MHVRLNQLARPIAERMARVPGGIEACLQICDAVGWTPDYDSGWRHLPHWLEETESAVERRCDASKSRILFFAYFQELVDYSLAMASVLIGRTNVHLDFVWVPYGTHTELVRLGYPYWRRSAERLPPEVHPRLRLYSLEKCAPAAITEGMRTICGDQAKADVSYILKQERTRLGSEPAHSRLYEYRLARNLDAVAKVAQILKQNDYDRVIMANGAIMELGAVYHYICEQGLQASTFEMWDKDGTIVVSSDTPVMSIDTHRLWERDEPHLLYPERRDRVERLLLERGRPRASSTAVAYQPTDGLTQTAELVPPDQVRAKLGLRPDRPVVLVCPNVPFDSMFYVERSRNFAAMWEWLVKTIEFLAQRTDCQVIVRSHPAEPQYDSDETTPSIIQEFFATLPSHITVLPAEAPINTYAVMQIADLGLVYASTTGLEMAVRGIPVVCGISNQHFNQKGFTIDPTSPEEYFSQIERVLQDPSGSRLEPRQVELASCYADLYFNEWPCPFPWLAGSQFWHDIKEWPVKRMLSPEGDKKFGTVFDVLLGHKTR